MQVIATKTDTEPEAQPGNAPAANNEAALQENEASTSAISDEQVRVMKKMVSDGLTRPKKWRRTQLKTLMALVRENEDAILSALYKDVGKVPIEAAIEVHATKGMRGCAYAFC